MSDLTRFRDHARQMATAEHKPECQKPRTDTRGWVGKHPDPDCDGCNPAVDRDLFKRLADEIDAYLDRPAEAVDLFGEVTAEPVHIADLSGIYADTGLTLDDFTEQR